MFTLAISYLTTSNLPWFMDLTFQVPMQYRSLQRQTLLPSPVTYTTGYCFCFGSISPFFLDLFLHWSPVAYWARTNLGSSSFSVLSFCLFILLMGFLRQEHTGNSKHPLAETREKTLHKDITNGQYRNHVDYILCSQRWRSSIQSEKTRLVADCCSDHELLIAKFRLKLKKVGKTAT